MDTFAIIKEFEKKLDELGLSYQGYPDNFYLLRHNLDVGRTIKVKLIYSDQADESGSGSQNGNMLESIGVFNFKILITENNTDFFILGFTSITYQRIDFVIIPIKELKRRLIKKNLNSTSKQKISIVFWLMADRFLYDCSGVGVEWEWFYLSRGLNGRMVDSSVWDYTEFLNDWNRLILIWYSSRLNLPISAN
jgi:hypothetical protein